MIIGYLDPEGKWIEYWVLAGLIISNGGLNILST